jgi:hypothetical protein
LSLNASNEAGVTEVYAASFPAFDNRKRLTRMAAPNRSWRADGKELFYLTPDGKLLMTMDVNPGPSMEFGVPHTLFQTPLAGTACCFELYGVTRDGQRFCFRRFSATSRRCVPSRSSSAGPRD